MAQLTQKDIEMLGKITEIIRDSDFDMRNVHFTEEAVYDKPHEYVTKLVFNLVRKNDN
jgi:hypothetical protein